MTHAHPDQFGSSHAVCEALGVPLWTGADDTVGHFVVLDVPGHSPGHIALWRDPERLACVAG